MSLCGMEFNACCTCYVNTGTASADYGGCWSYRPIISHTCSIDDRSGNLAGLDAVRNATAVCRIRWSSLSVVPRGRPEPGALEAVYHPLTTTSTIMRS
ncbi:hypothetical protein TNCV_4461031 [Trichonephila clavipes]|nr:hypothetical protein TNCV_4461031 [Trichonephila clavipes]